MPNEASQANQRILVGYGYGIAAATMWGMYLAFAREGVNDGLTPADSTLIRFVAAGTIMAVWLVRHDPGQLAGVGWTRGAILACLAGPPFILISVGGYMFAPLSHGAVALPSSSTLFSILVATIVLKESLSLSRTVGLFVMIFALVLLASGNNNDAMPGAWRGDLLFVTAGALWAVYSLLLKKWSIGGMASTAAVCVISACVFTPYFLIFETFDRILALSPTMLVAQVLVQGVLTGVGAIVCFGACIQRIGVGRAALFIAIVPAVALLVGIPLTQEYPTTPEWIGAILATLGLMIALDVFKFQGKTAPRG